MATRRDVGMWLSDINLEANLIAKIIFHCCRFARAGETTDVKAGFHSGEYNNNNNLLI